MTTNVGMTDRVIRAAIAIALIGLAWHGDIVGTGSIVAYAVSFVLLMTSIVSICPIYSLLGISTCPVKKA
jgi:Protein of unknown function (DUF2892)